MAGPIPLSFDVTEALPAEASEGRRILISCWLFFPEDPAKLADRPAAITLGAGGSYDKRYHHADGHIIWVTLSVSLVRDSGGDPLYFISQIEDISNRKQLEDQYSWRKEPEH